MAASLSAVAPPLPRPWSPLAGLRLSLRLQCRLWRIVLALLLVAVAIKAQPQNNSQFSVAKGLLGADVASRVPTTPLASADQWCCRGDIPMSPALGDYNKNLNNNILPCLFAGDMGMSPLHAMLRRCPLTLKDFGELKVFNSQLKEVFNSQLKEVKEGDLLFVAQAEDNAITEVTQGVDGLAIDHVAILHRIGGDLGPLYALEAIPRQGVVLTPIDSLLAREQAAKFVIGRVDDVDATASVRNAMRYVGKPYDDLFQPGDSAIYCSELVQMCYVDIDGNQVFGTIPMSFHDASGRILDHWTEFYRNRGMAVPEGFPGTNPGQLSRHPNVTIIFSQIESKICNNQRE